MALTERVKLRVFQRKVGRCKTLNNSFTATPELRMKVWRLSALRTLKRVFLNTNLGGTAGFAPVPFRDGSFFISNAQFAIRDLIYNFITERFTSLRNFTEC